MGDLVRILVTGSRHWKNEVQIAEKLIEWCEIYHDLVIAHGKSPGGGVDLIVEDLCELLDIDQDAFPILPLDGNHRGAPLNRNKRMVQTFKPDRVVGFRSPGKSNGTDFTLAFAEKMGYPTEVIDEERPS